MMSPYQALIVNNSKTLFRFHFTSSGVFPTNTSFKIPIPLPITALLAIVDILLFKKALKRFFLAADSNTLFASI